MKTRAHRSEVGSLFLALAFVGCGKTVPPLESPEVVAGAGAFGAGGTTGGVFGPGGGMAPIGGIAGTGRPTPGGFAGTGPSIGPGFTIAGTGARGGIAGAGFAGFSGSAGFSATAGFSGSGGVPGTGGTGAVSVSQCLVSADPSHVLPFSCTACICTHDAARTFACGALCWTLIDCVGAQCQGPSDPSCITSKCSSYLGGATQAMAVPLAMCASQCVVPNTDAGTGIVSSDAGD